MGGAATASVRVGAELIKRSSAERDLGVSRLSASQQCAMVARKANGTPGWGSYKVDPPHLSGQVSLMVRWNPWAAVRAHCPSSWH